MDKLTLIPDLTCDNLKSDERFIVPVGTPRIEEYFIHSPNLLQRL